MHSNDVENRLKQVFSDVFGVHLKEISESSSPNSVETWDSLQHVVFVASIEEEFSIKIEPENAMEMLNFEQIKKIIFQLVE